MVPTSKAKGFTPVIAVLDAITLIHSTELIHTLSYLTVIALNVELTVLTGAATIFVPESVRSHLKLVADVVALHPYTNFYTLAGIPTIAIVKFTKSIGQLW